jgi:hypothetical protein
MQVGLIILNAQDGDVIDTVVLNVKHLLIVKNNKHV